MDYSMKTTNRHKLMAMGKPIKAARGGMMSMGKAPMRSMPVANAFPYKSTKKTPGFKAGGKPKRYKDGGDAFEGPNPRISDDTRERPLAWVKRQNSEEAEKTEETPVISKRSAAPAARSRSTTTRSIGDEFARAPSMSKAEMQETADGITNAGAVAGRVFGVSRRARSAEDKEETSRNLFPMMIAGALTAAAALKSPSALKTLGGKSASDAAAARAMEKAAEGTARQVRVERMKSENPSLETRGKMNLGVSSQRRSDSERARVRGEFSSANRAQRNLEERTGVSGLRKGGVVKKANVMGRSHGGSATADRQGRALMAGKMGKNLSMIAPQSAYAKGGEAKPSSYDRKQDMAMQKHANKPMGVAHKAAGKKHGGMTRRFRSND